MSKEKVTLGSCSAYSIALKNGFVGTETEWLRSLCAHVGENGNWFVGDEDLGVLADPAQLQELTNDAIDSAGRAEAAAEELRGTIEDVNQLKGDLAANEKADAVTKRSLDALWKLNQGISYDFVTDSENAYDKIVPAGCKYAAVESIGGYTEVIDGELVSADVASVQCDGIVMANVPDAVRALPGYGGAVSAVRNRIERTDDGWQYVQRIGRIDLGVLDWQARGNCVFSLKWRTQMIFVNDSPCLCPIYKASTLASNQIINYNKVISTHVSYGYGDLMIRDTDFTDADSLKASLSGVPLHYVLATPIITDITDLMGNTLDLIAVEPDSTLTLENAAKLPVQSTVQYIRDLKEVNA